MNEKIKVIQEIEKEIEEALWSLEVHEEIEAAYRVYLDAETKLLAIKIATSDFEYTEQQRVLAYCLMRQGNLLRQMGKPEEAFLLSKREIAAARASKDEIMLARSLMSYGTNRVVAGEVNEGLALLDEASEIFTSGDSYDYQQGVGWYWILLADLSNAGIIEKEPVEVVEIATRALEILKPIENWPGVARAYAARAEANKRLGNDDETIQDLDKQAYFQRKTESDTEAS